MPPSPDTSYAEPRSCKICGDPRLIRIGAVDFNRADANRDIFPPMGVDVDYWQCRLCGFAWAPAFDHWSEDDFRTHIYNDRFHEIELPEFAESRAKNIVERIKQWFPKSHRPRILDWGCGPGLLVDLLTSEGYNAVGYDGFQPGFEQLPKGKYDLVTCFEVLEHVPDPDAFIADVLGYLKPQGVVLIGTYLTDMPMKLDWWYCVPRGGHIAFHTPASLARLFAPHGYRVITDGRVFHCAHKPNDKKIIKRLLPHLPNALN